MAIARLSKIKSQVRVRAYENLKTGKDPERAFHLFNSQFKGVFTMLVALESGLLGELRPYSCFIHYA